MSVVMIRTVIVYIIIIISLRIMGKRQIGELQPSELVVTILVSNLATISIDDSGMPLLSAVIPIFTIVCCEVLVSYLIMKSGGAQRLISGNSRIVIRDGIIDQKEMKNLRWTIEDLMEQLRISGTFDLAEVAFAIVETSGQLSVYQKSASRPLTPQTMNGTPGEDMPPVLMISDGRIVKEALSYCGVDKKWVEDLIDNKNIRLKDIFVMTCDRKLSYSFIKKDGAHRK